MPVLWFTHEIEHIGCSYLRHCSFTQVCIKYNLDEVIEEEFNEPIFENIINQEQDGIGLAHRNAFILRHFS